MDIVFIVSFSLLFATGITWIATDFKDSFLRNISILLIVFCFISLVGFTFKITIKNQYTSDIFTRNNEIIIKFSKPVLIEETTIKRQFGFGLFDKKIYVINIGDTK